MVDRDWEMLRPHYVEGPLGPLYSFTSVQTSTRLDAILAGTKWSSRRMPNRIDHDDEPAPPKAPGRRVIRTGQILQCSGQQSGRADEGPNLHRRSRPVAGGSARWSRSSMNTPNRLPTTNWEWSRPRAQKSKPREKIWPRNWPILTACANRPCPSAIRKIPMNWASSVPSLPTHGRSGHSAAQDIGQPRQDLPFR